MTPEDLASMKASAQSVIDGVIEDDDDWSGDAWKQANNVLTLVPELEKARERTASVGCLCVEGADGRCVCR